MSDCPVLKRLDIEATEGEGVGWKLLDPTGATYYDSIACYYPLPRPSERWGPWFEHPDPAPADGKDCGPGRLHVMQRLSAQYAPRPWWPWIAEYRGIVGASEEKVGVRALRLRLFSREAFWEAIREGLLAEANLHGADLHRAILYGADLHGADTDALKGRGAIL